MGILHPRSSPHECIDTHWPLECTLTHPVDQESSPLAKATT